MNAEQFLYREARLLDEQRYEEWLALFTADATYWVPLERDQADPYAMSSIIHDDRTLLEVRVRQYRHARSHARLPLPRTVHQVGNVVLLSASAEVMEIASTLTVVEYRAERQRLWGALVQHKLRRESESWKIVHKRVDLANSEAELDGVTILF